MNKLAPIEFKNQRIMTTKTLAEEFGTEEKNIQMNFSNNEKRFVANKHYFKLEGELLKGFKNSLPNDIGSPFKFASSLILWTEKGAARHAKILDTDEAWEVYEALEETYFSVKEAKPSCIEDVLIQSLQEMKDMRVQLQQTNAKVIEANTNAAEAKEEVQAIRDTVVVIPEDWRRWCVDTLRGIAFRNKMAYDEVNNLGYDSLEARAGCDLEIRLKNRRKNGESYGVSKSKIASYNYLDVIGDDKKLTEIYLQIVKEMAIKYKVA